MEGHLTSSGQDRSRLGEEIIICGLSLDGGDEHGVTSILVRLQLYIVGKEREGKKEIGRRRKGDGWDREGERRERRWGRERER